MRANQKIWALVLGTSKSCLDRINGSTLLSIAISKFRGERCIGRVFVGTHDDEVARVAKAEGAMLPRSTTIDINPELDARAQGFLIADTLVDDRRWGSPYGVVFYDPRYPFITFPTLTDVVQGLKKKWSSILCNEVMPGLVMPINAAAGHRYSPRGCRPHEDYHEFTRFARQDWNVQLVNVNNAAECYKISNKETLNIAQCMATGRAFKFSVEFDYATMYVPSGRDSLGCFLPKDADFVFDERHDRRIFRAPTMTHVRQA